mgnify:CR=1 FL=1
MRWGLRTALAVMLLCGCAASAGAGPVYRQLKADTLYKYCSDSSSVLRVDNLGVMTLEFVATPTPDTLGALADTLIELLVSAREHLPADIITSTATSTTAATASDSTVIAWIPRYGWTAGSQTDTMTVNNVSPAASAMGSNEIRVWIRPATKNVNGVLQRRTATLDLVNVSTGLPFSAKWASFKWRLASGPAIANLRVILKSEVW